MDGGGERLVDDELEKELQRGSRRGRRRGARRREMGIGVLAALEGEIERGERGNGSGKG